ncbi:polysaccharide biosynthesis tyrosine autokinase, partial [candidate division KSB1 bacterium]|nr:polysaccharide biosynthesis tyrosine autokinase [candidate division KSB1 bacterium]
RLEAKRDELLLQASSDSLQMLRLEYTIAEKKESLRRKILDVFDKNEDKSSGKNNQLRVLLNERLVTEQVSLNSLRNREKFYRELLAQYRRQSPEMLDRDIELARLQRTQIVHQNLLNYLVERHEEAKIKASSSLGGLRTVTPAGIPQEPLQTRAARNILLSIFFGLGLGFGLALLLDYLDQTVRNRDELERLTGLQVIGQIPQHDSHLSNGTAAAKPNGHLATLPALLRRLHQAKQPTNGHILENYPVTARMRADTPFSEAFRDLRTNLQFYQIDQPLKKVLITSSIPGEGKTVLTSNLALSLTELKKRVVIIDADLRKPRQSGVFGLERVPGFTDYFMDTATYDEILRPVRDDLLYVIPSGRIPPNPTEILHSQKMADLIRRLEGEFDYVLLDSPPLLSVSDSKVLAAMIQTVILVSRFGHTEKRYIKEAIGYLRKSRADVVGLVFNGIEVTRGSGYYKYHYYYEAKKATAEKTRMN